VSKDTDYTGTGSNKDQEKSASLINAIKLKKLPPTINRSEINTEVMKELINSNDADLITEAFSKTKLTAAQINEYRIPVSSTGTDSKPSVVKEYTPFEYALSHEESGRYIPKLGAAESLIKSGKEASTLRETSGVKLDRIIESTDGDLSGFTPLTYFVSKSNINAVKNVLDNGANPNFQSRNGLPISLAFYAIDLERPKDNLIQEIEKTKAFQVSSLLLERGADLQEKSVGFTKTTSPEYEKLNAELDSVKNSVTEQRNKVTALKKESTQKRKELEELSKEVGPDSDSDANKKKTELLKKEIDDLTKNVNQREVPIKEQDKILQNKRSELLKMRKDGRDMSYSIDPTKTTSLKESVVNKQTNMRQEVRQDSPFPTLYAMLLDKQSKLQLPKNLQPKATSDSLAPYIAKINNQVEKVATIKENINIIKEKIQDVENQKKILPENASFKNLRTYRHIVKSTEKEVSQSLAEINKAIRSSQEEYLKTTQSLTDAQVAFGDSLKEHRLANKNLKTLQEKANQIEKVGNKQQQLASKIEISKAEKDLKASQIKVNQLEQSVVVKKQEMIIAEMAISSMQQYKGDLDLTKEKVHNLRQEAQNAKEERDRKSTFGRLKTEFSKSFSAIETKDPSQLPKQNLSKTEPEPLKSPSSVKRTLSSLETITEGSSKSKPKSDITDPRESQIISNKKISPNLKEKAQNLGKILQKNGLINENTHVSSNINQKPADKIKGPAI